MKSPDLSGGGLHFSRMPQNLSRKTYAPGVRLRRGVFGLVFILSLLLSPGQGSCAAAKKGPLEDATFFRVASWDIAASREPDVALMGAELSRYDIDVAGLQEVDRFTERNCCNMLAALQKSRFPYGHFAKTMDYEGGDYGLALVSRIPTAEVSTTPLDSAGTEEARVYERVVLERGGLKIAVYNTQLSEESAAVRARQLRQLKAAVEADPVPYRIITGDFNINRSTDELDLFRKDFRFADGERNRWYDTVNGKEDLDSVLSLDNILVSKNLGIMDAHMIRNNLSDHNMLYVDVEVPGTPKS